MATITDTQSDFSHYFDWAATTPADAQIMQSALSQTQNVYANPSSVHAEGLKAKELLARARERCAKALGVKAETLIFTSGGTESDHLPILSLLQKPQVRGNGESRGTIVISAIEHPAIREQAAMMKNCGFTVVQVPPEKNGIISTRRLMEAVDASTVLVCVMAVNNETGAVQPVYEIADSLSAFAAGKKKPKFHVDAVQTIGKIPFSLAYKGIDTAAISAHKLRGGRGIGLLYMAGRQEPFIRGGAQENGLRPGTENVFGALCLAACLERYALTPKETPTAQNTANSDKTAVGTNNAVNSDIAAGTNNAVNSNAGNAALNQTTAPHSPVPPIPPLQNDSARTRLLAQYDMCVAFIKSLNELSACTVIPACRLEPCAGAQYSPWIVQASFKGIPGEVMVRALSEKGFYISTGSACSARKMSRPVLEAMGVAKTEATNAVRFSFGSETTECAMQELLHAVKDVCALFKV